MNLSGKVALVTGSSRGIGRGIALELAKKGASVVVNYKEDEEGAIETSNIIKKIGGYSVIQKCDVGDYKQCSNMIENIIKMFGKIDILVNNAGISKVGLFVDMNEDDFDDIMNTNLKGVFNVTHNAVKHMIKKKSGVILNLSSIWGNCGASCEVLYSASKGGINAFTKSLAKELAPSGIRVNAVAPGVIETDMNKCFSENDKKLIKEDIPLLKFGEPEDVGKVAVFLCSEDAKYITGQIVTVDGGMI